MPKAYRVYNFQTSIMEEGIYVKSNDYKHDKNLSELEECSGFDMRVKKNS